MADDKEREGTELVVAEFHKKIKDAFEVFDHEANNTVDSGERSIHIAYFNLQTLNSVGEIGTIIRSLGCCPSEGELHDLIVEVLDPSKRGFLTKEELIKYMTEEGEPFSQEEMEEMLSAAIDPESNSIRYKDYIAMMVVDDG
ncbi:dynein regulatory complex protein 8 isoform 3-T3 [Lycaon pictus]